LSIKINNQKAKGKRQKWDTEGSAALHKNNNVPPFWFLPFAFCLLIS